MLTKQEKYVKKISPVCVFPSSSVVKLNPSEREKKSVLCLVETKLMKSNWWSSVFTLSLSLSLIAVNAHTAPLVSPLLPSFSSPFSLLPPISSLSFISCLLTLLFHALLTPSFLPPFSFSPSFVAPCHLLPVLPPPPPLPVGYSGTSHKHFDMKWLSTFPTYKNNVVEIEAVKCITVFKWQIWLYWSVWAEVMPDFRLSLLNHESCSLSEFTETLFFTLFSFFGKEFVSLLSVSSSTIYLNGISAIKVIFFHVF